MDPNLTHIIFMGQIWLTHPHLQKMVNNLMIIVNLCTISCTETTKVMLVSYSKSDTDGLRKELVEAAHPQNSDCNLKESRG